MQRYSLVGQCHHGCIVMSHRNHPVLWFAITLLAGCGPAPDTDSSGIDALERQLEIDRHEQLLSRKSEPGATVTDFTTDGCSGGLTIGWEYLAGKITDFQTLHGKQPAWEACCVAHDRRYHKGGARQITADKSFLLRQQADLELRDCVIATGSLRAPVLYEEYGLLTNQVEILYISIADLMYRAVRIGGIPCSGLPWRWGYGWPTCN